MAKPLKDIIGGKGTSHKKKNDLGGYAPKAGDEQKFAQKHDIEVQDDRNGNGDDVFKGTTKLDTHKRQNPSVYEARGVEEAKCNESAKGVSCPVHGMNECTAVENIKEDDHQYIEVTSKTGAKRHVKVHPSKAYAALNQYKGQGNKARIVSKPSKPTMKEEVEQIDEDITKMPDARLKFHVMKGVPHGSFSSKDMNSEHQRRKKTGGAEYAAVKPALKEEVEAEEIEEARKRTDTYLGTYKSPEEAREKHGKNLRIRPRLGKDSPHAPLYRRGGEHYRSSSQDIKPEHGAHFDAYSRKPIAKVKEEVEQVDEDGHAEYKADLPNMHKDLKAKKKSTSQMRREYGSSWKRLMHHTNQHYDAATRDNAIAMAHKHMNEEVEQVDEVITKKTSAGEVISDFVHSKNPKFAGKSKEKRKQMALAAYYAKQREQKEEVESVDEAKKNQYIEVTNKHTGAKKHIETHPTKAFSALNRYKDKNNTARIVSSKPVKEDLAVPLLGGEPRGDSDEAAEMVKSELKALANKAMHLVMKMPDSMHVEPWCQAKIAQAKAYVNDVHDYMVYGDHENEDMADTSGASGGSAGGAMVMNQTDTPMTFPNMSVDVNTGRNV